MTPFVDVTDQRAYYTYMNFFLVQESAPLHNFSIPQNLGWIWTFPEIGHVVSRRKCAMKRVDLWRDFNTATGAAKSMRTSYVKLQILNLGQQSRPQFSHKIAERKTMLTWSGRGFTPYSESLSSWSASGMRKKGKGQRFVMFFVAERCHRHSFLHTPFAHQYLKRNKTMNKKQKLPKKLTRESLYIALIRICSR